MRLLISVVAAFIIATNSGCGVSEVGETSELDQEVVQTCAVHADCSAFAADECLPNQVGVCRQANTPSAYCSCVTTTTPSNPSYPEPVPGSGCWQILNDCVALCDSSDWYCRNACHWDWGTCGF